MAKAPRVPKTPGMPKMPAGGPRLPKMGLGVRAGPTPTGGPTLPKMPKMPK